MEWATICGNGDMKQTMYVRRGSIERCVSHWQQPSHFDHSNHTEVDFRAVLIGIATSRFPGPVGLMKEHDRTPEDRRFPATSCSCQIISRVARLALRPPFEFEVKYIMYRIPVISAFI